MSNKVQIIKGISLVIAVCSIIVMFYGFYQFGFTDNPYFGLSFSVFCFSLTNFVIQTNRFKQRNHVKQLIHRNGDILTIKNAQKNLFGTMPMSEQAIEIARISKVTVADNYLSIIVDGNGNGFDFFLHNASKDIKKHLISLLSPIESNSICIQNA